MKSPLLIVFLVAALSVGAQTVVNPFMALHPIMKDPNKRNAPTSLDQDPSEKKDFQQAAPARRCLSFLPFRGSTPATGQAGGNRCQDRSQSCRFLDQPARHGQWIKGRLRDEHRLASGDSAGPICRVRPEGLSSRLHCQNRPALAPNDAEKIEVLATNLNAVDLKLMKLTTGSGKK